MALGGREAAVCASVGATIHARRQFKINVVRYADDFVMTGISKEILEHTAPQTIPQCMAVRGPELSEEKTRITLRTPRRRPTSGAVALPGFITRFPPRSARPA